MGSAYSESFKQQAVELYRLDDDVTYADVARDMGCSVETIRNWNRQARIDDGEVGGVTSNERERLVALEAENVRLAKEVRILKAAMAYFAKHQL